MNLRDLIDEYPILSYNGSLDIEVKGLSDDSRKIKKGQMFIALKGFTVDGHDYIDEAIVNGASCIVYEDISIARKNGVTQIRVKDTLDALAYLSNKYYDNPWSKLNMIGITGTNGKTSTTHLIKGILENNNRKAGIIGTLGLIIGKENIPLGNTTPNILVTLESIKKMLDMKLDTCIMEVSSHSLAMSRVKGFEFDIGIFTNLTKEHLDYHKNMEDYFQSKLKLIENTIKHCIVNMDDPYGQRIIKEIPYKNYVTYGIENNADVMAENIIYNIDGVEYNLKYNNQTIPLKLNIPGRFSVYNSLASISCGLALKLPIDSIVAALGSYKSIKGRFEVLAIDKEFNVIIDFAHTPDGLFNVLSTISEFAKGRIIVVFGAGGDRDRSKRSIMGEVVGKLADYAIVTSDNPRNEKPEKIIDDILVGINKTGVEYKSIVDRKEAIKYALDIAKDNDIILLAGKGHEEKMIIGDRVVDFNEREIVSQFIKDSKLT